MDGQKRFCVRCGHAYIQGHNFCSRCGAYFGVQEQKQECEQACEPQVEQIEAIEQTEQIEKTEQTEQVDTIEKTPIIKPKKKSYKARKFLSLGFAIADIFVALSCWICAIICEKVSILIYYEKRFYEVGSFEYKLSEISDIYYFVSGVGYALAILFAVGFVVSAIMFFVYLKKGIDAKRALALEAQEKQGQIFEEAEEVLEETEEVTEEAEEQTKEKEPQIEIQESQNQEQV